MLGLRLQIPMQNKTRTQSSYPNKREEVKQLRVNSSSLVLSQSLPAILLAPYGLLYESKPIRCCNGVINCAVKYPCSKLKKCNEHESTGKHSSIFGNENSAVSRFLNLTNVFHSPIYTGVQVHIGRAISMTSWPGLEVRRILSILAARQKG